MVEAFDIAEETKIEREEKISPISCIWPVRNHFRAGLFAFVLFVLVVKKSGMEWGGTGKGAMLGRGAREEEGERQLAFDGEACLFNERISPSQTPLLQPLHGSAPWLRACDGREAGRER